MKLRPESLQIDDYLQSSSVIDWQTPAIQQQARVLAQANSNRIEVAKATFEWVRDEIRHSRDFQMNPVTCNASDVLTHKTGYCYAKSHLLAALLRANGIPTGFCYQRLSINDNGAPYSLHGLNAIHLEGFGWFRVDARGNRGDIYAIFNPPHESMAFIARLEGEFDLPEIYLEPMPVVVEALRNGKSWDHMLANLPDISAVD